jgi:flagellar biosynthesis GTPase FlhF
VHRLPLTILSLASLFLMTGAARAEDVTKTLHTPYGSAATVMDKYDFQHKIDLCLKGTSSAGFLAGNYDRDENTCSQLSDSIFSQNKDPSHMLIAAWYGRQDCDRWSDTAHCILGTLRPLIDYPGTFSPVQDVVDTAKQACNGKLTNTLRFACNFAGKYFLKHGEPLVADAILQNTCSEWLLWHGGDFNCEDVGAPEEVAKRKVAAEKRQQLRDAQEMEQQRQQLAAEREQQAAQLAQAAAQAQWLQSPQGQQWQAQQLQQDIQARQQAQQLQHDAQATQQALQDNFASERAETDANFAAARASENRRFCIQSCYQSVYGVPKQRCDAGCVSAQKIQYEQCAIYTCGGDPVLFNYGH